VKLKIPGVLFDRALSDLERPHRFAAERVGFFSTKTTRVSDLVLIHCVEYHPADDEHYLRDGSVGARIGSAAITEAMARCATNNVGQLHIHTHGGRGEPRPSVVDNAETPSLARSFSNANQHGLSGWGVLSEDSAWVSVYSLGIGADCRPQVTIVGYPLTINPAIRLAPRTSAWWRRLIGSRRRSSSRYERQSFLGPSSERIFSNVRIAIVGLGGGGSHIAQQLAHLGVFRFVIFDDDRISETNLNRTIGAIEADLDHGSEKTAITKRLIRGLHPNADILVFGKWESNSEALLHCDIVVGCVDTFAGRRDLESFCRRHVIPYVDIGMDVQKFPDGAHEIIGQVILSMPGRPCMRCMGFLTDQLLAEEARMYGAAGGRPQVVWSNGIICSAAVGIIVDLVTGWSGNPRESIYLNFRGSDLSLCDDRRLEHLPATCAHYPLIEAGDPVWKSL